MNKRKKQTTRRKGIKFLRDEQVYLVTCNGKSNKYGIGSVVPVGSCAYKEERGPWTAKTLEDAKQMAEDFASNMTAVLAEGEHDGTN